MQSEPRSRKLENVVTVYTAHRRNGDERVNRYAGRNL